jgi:SAM-dependent methyltransferase
MDTWDRFWSSRAEAADFYPQHERIERAVREAGEWRGARSLEVGCGLGGSAAFQLELGIRPVLLDSSSASLAKCRAQLGREARVALVRGDAFRLPFKDGSLDLVFHQGLIEHFRGDAPDRIVRENLRVLRPGGAVVVDVPQAFHWESVVARPLIWTGKWFAGWQTYYTPAGLRRLAGRLGLSGARYYGAWMSPSFFYRALRLALRRWVALPTRPPRVPAVARLREAARRRLFHHPLALWTGASIGFLARKPTVSRGG